CVDPAGGGREGVARGRVPVREHGDEQVSRRARGGKRRADRVAAASRLGPGLKLRDRSLDRRRADRKADRDEQTQKEQDASASPCQRGDHRRTPNTMRASAASRAAMPPTIASRSDRRLGSSEEAWTGALTGGTPLKTVVYC